ncbi:hypothetical protein D3C72_2301320 [compost metagenome]
MTLPGHLARQARKSSLVALLMVTAKTEPMVARTASTEKGSTQSPIRMTPPQPAESAVRMMVPRLPGSRTCSSATQQGLASGLMASSGV